MTAIAKDEWVAAALSRVSARAPALRSSWSDEHKPFRYVVADDFLPPDFAESIYECYPPPDVEGWDQITYTHQRKKFVRTGDFPTPIAAFFDLMAHPEFLSMLEGITGIKSVLADPSLVGGGLHQIVRGGFLDVHVDFNFHPETKLHRRMNLLVYMNKGWQPEYGGQLELWDMKKDERIEDLAPDFNRAVLFETTEHSFHGHPRPLATPSNVTRKSLAVYYYTKEREQAAVAPEHNTLYRQTTGLAGYLKTTRASLEASTERLRSGGLIGLTGVVTQKLVDRALGRRPKNQ
jgi:hypothetical protein